MGGTACTVSARAIVSGLYAHLPSNGSELVLFDLNQAAKLGPLLRSPDESRLARIELANPEYRQDDQGGFNERQDDAPIDVELGAAVEPGGVFKIARQPLDELHRGHRRGLW